VEFIAERTRLEYNVADDNSDEKEKFIVAAKRVWKSARDKKGMTPERKKKNNTRTRRTKRTESLGKRLVAVLTVPTRSLANDD
jgi:hypothetical protein